jgi:hypothetical protein
MDEVGQTRNCVTTECGHCFHASCLMTSVAHNGFSCPYCRTAMAEEVANEEENDEDWTHYDNDDEDDDEEVYQDYVLRGLRFFMNNLNGVAHDAEDLAEEDDEQAGEGEAEEEEEEETPKPSVEFIAKALSDQGVTLEQLVKSLLADHEEYQDDEDIERLNDELFGKFRIIISNYKPAPQPEVLVVEPEELLRLRRVEEDRVRRFEVDPRIVARSLWAADEI